MWQLPRSLPRADAISPRERPMPSVIPGEIDRFVWRCGKADLSTRELTALHDAGASLPSHAWGQVAWVARTHGMAPLVFTHTAHANLLPLMPPNVVEQLRRAYCETLVRNRRMQIELGRMLPLLAERGVDVLLMKGVTLAARYYQHIALRPVNDIDLLVRRPRLKQCLQVLSAAGYVPKSGVGNPRDFKVLYNLELLYTNQDGICIEPHVGLARLPAYNAALSVDGVWERAELVEVGGVSVRYLRSADELRYLSLHYAVPHRGQRMIWLVDIAELVRNRAATWDWDAFTDETITLGLATPLAIALERARELLDLEVPADSLDRLALAAATRRERDAWHFAHAPLSDAGRFGQHLRALPTPTEQLAFLWGAATVGTRKARQRVNRLGPIGALRHTHRHPRRPRSETFAQVNRPTRPGGISPPP